RPGDSDAAGLVVGEAAAGGAEPGEVGHQVARAGRRDLDAGRGGPLAAGVGAAHLVGVGDAALGAGVDEAGAGGGADVLEVTCRRPGAGADRAVDLGVGRAGG